MKKTLLLMFGGLLAAAQPVAASSDIPVYGTAPAGATQKTETNAEIKRSTSPKKLPAKPATEKSLPPPSKTTMNLINAIRVGNYEMAELMLSQGGDINCRNCNYAGVPPLMGLYEPVMGHNLSPRLIWMLERGANPNLPDNSGKTLLMRMAEHQITNPYYSGIDDFEYLLGHGASVTAKDAKGNTVLHYLAMHSPGDKEAMRNGGFGDSAYDMAKQWMRAYEKVIARGADINATNKSGDTPLMYLASSCNPDNVSALLADGADRATKNKINQTALQIAFDKASRNSNKVCNRVVEILRSPSVEIALSSPAPTKQSKPSGFQDMKSSTEWIGIFRAVTPRSGNANVSVVVSPSGAVSFKSSSGLQGNGIMSVQQEKVSASVTAMSPRDENGRPIFGANEIIFDMNGNLENGVITGKYTSLMESGTFVLCSPEVRQKGKGCEVPSTGNPLGGLLKALETLSGR